MWGKWLGERCVKMQHPPSAFLPAVVLLTCVDPVCSGCEAPLAVRSNPRLSSQVRPVVCGREEEWEVAGPDPFNKQASKQEEWCGGEEEGEKKGRS